MTTFWFYNRHKYRIAVFDRDSNIINKIHHSLKVWFSNKIIIKTYTNSSSMFTDLNIAKAKSLPFDMAIVGPDEGVATQLVLKNTNPGMKIVKFKDEASLKKDTANLTFKV